MTKTPLHTEKAVWWEVQEWITEKDTMHGRFWKQPGWLRRGSTHHSEDSARKWLETYREMLPNSKIQLIRITKTVESITLYTPDGTQEAE